jgi:hypothetical protein
MSGNEAETFAQASHNYQGILLEYCYLASLPTLSEEQADYLDRILAQAETDEFLNFLLIEFDYIIAKKLNLLNDQRLSQYEDQQAYLREHLTPPEDLDYYRELQKLLRDRGYYRGLVDGVFGEDSRKAVEQFQEATHLQVSGVLTPETVLKLAPTAEAALKLTRSRSPDDR